MAKSIRVMLSGLGARTPNHYIVAQLIWFILLSSSSFPNGSETSEPTGTNIKLVRTIEKIHNLIGKQVVDYE